MITMTNIDHINMKVKDLKASQRFYGDLFGFKEKESGVRDGRPWSIVGLPGRLYLCLYEVGDVEKVDQDLQINHFGFNVEDFDAVTTELRRQNVYIFDGGPVENGQFRSIYIADPSGYKIELSEVFGGGLN